MRIHPRFEKLLNSLSDDEPSDIADGSIVIDSVSKAFKKHTVIKKSYSTIKSGLINRLFRSRFPRDNFLQALETISIDIKPGSSLGVIGRNGSGKSTLLKLIAGIYQPDGGTIKVRGRISALIELGAGFHPDFTGRENVFLGGVMYGLTKRQIEERFDDIVKYAELEEFIDDPVRTYSSGMYMRLGFSLAIHTDPDILLIDEVLAVGDAAFIHRCHETISEFKRQQKTLIFVTHDLDSVTRWCDEAIWLEKGRVRERGEPRWVIDSYLQQVQEGEESVLVAKNRLAAAEGSERGISHDGLPLHPDSKRWGNGDVEISNVRLVSGSGEEKWIFRGDEAATIEVDYRIVNPVEDLIFGVAILRADGMLIHGTNTDIDEVDVPLPEDILSNFARASVTGGVATEFVETGSMATGPATDQPISSGNSFQSGLTGTYRYRIERLSLLENTYYIDVAAHRLDGLPFDYHHLRYRFSVRNQTGHQGIFAPESGWEFKANYPVAAAKAPGKSSGKEAA